MRLSLCLVVLLSFLPGLASADDMSGLGVIIILGFFAVYLGATLIVTFAVFVFRVVLLLVYIHVRNLHPMKNKILLALILSSLVMLTVSLLQSAIEMYQDQFASSYSSRVTEGGTNIKEYSIPISLMGLAFDFLALYIILNGKVPLVEIFGLWAVMNILFLVFLPFTLIGIAMSGSLSGYVPPEAGCQDLTGAEQYMCFKRKCDTPSRFNNYPICNLKKYFDPGICIHGKDIYERGACHSLFAEAYNDPSICEKVEYELNRQNCYETIAIKKHDKKLCERAYSPESCISQIG